MSHCRPRYAIAGLDEDGEALDLRERARWPDPDIKEIIQMILLDPEQTVMKDRMFCTWEHNYSIWLLWWVPSCITNCADESRLNPIWFMLSQGFQAASQSTVTTTPKCRRQLTRPTSLIGSTTSHLTRGATTETNIA